MIKYKRQLKEAVTLSYALGITFVLWRIMINGKQCFLEPNILIISAEFIIAIFLCMWAITDFYKALRDKNI